MFSVTYPRDLNGNKIGDAWEYDDGQLPGHDADPYPASVQSGDGFSAYEEYRGFIINSVHFRTSPEGKDIFIYDEDNLDASGAMEHFDASGLTIRKLSSASEICRF